MDRIIKEKQRTIKKSVSREKTTPHKSIVREQIKARNRDGDKPANQTKKIIPISLSQNENFFPRIFLPVPPARDEKKERCMPLKARMWERPARLKDSITVESVYSLEPESNERIKPPHSFHPYISFLNLSLHKALK